MSQGSENQARGSESRNFKNSHQEGVLLLSWGLTQVMSVPPAQQPGLGTGAALLLRKVWTQRSPRCLRQEAGGAPASAPSV